MPIRETFRPSRRHEALGDAFYDRVKPAAFPLHLLRYRNQRWAARIGLDTLDEKEWIAHFGCFEPLPGSLPEPLALRYHGHQFRSYNPDLGDGRGFLFAQCHDPADGRLLDLGTKGSGRTPWSRGGDGRLTLKGGIREILATSMLEALGVDTSRSFSLIETGEELARNDEPSPARSAVLVRLSHSHIRIGTFQRLLYLDQHEDIARLVDHCLETYLSEAGGETQADRAVRFLEAVSRRVASTGAQWMLAGFVHGVLNTDNINITGESFDYGPWRFLPHLDPEFTAAYFDHSGLYAFGRQPDTLLWNLTRLAECLLHLAPQEQLEKVLERFGAVFRHAFNQAIATRLGIEPAQEGDDRLARSIWPFLHQTRMPFERFFFDWHGGIGREAFATAGPAASFYADEMFTPVHDAIADRPPRAGETPSHPYFEGAAPCTMLIEEVEALWDPIAAHDDWHAFEQKLREIDNMRQAYERVREPRP